MYTFKQLDQINKSIISKISESKKILHLLYLPKSKIVIDLNLLNKDDFFQNALLKRCSDLNTRYIRGEIVKDFIKNNNIMLDIFIDDDRLPYFKPSLIFTSDQILVLYSSVVKRFIKDLK